MTPAPAQLHLPGIPVAPPPIESEIIVKLLPIEITSRGADLKFIAMCRHTYASLVDACQAAEAMGLV